MANPNLNTSAPSKRFLLWVFKEIPEANPNMDSLPRELQNGIIKYLIDEEMEGMEMWTPTPQPIISPAFTAPASGASPLMSLPTELRRQIFAGSLPAREVIHHPSCKCDARARYSSKNDPNSKPRRNRVSDLMTLSKKISSEIAEVLYEERFFVIHLHECLRDGGIEFLDAGRQPLQYQDSIEDPRFHKFGKDDEFGFRRLKKVIVQIYATTEDSCRHTAINSYFMNLALCRLLERSGEEKYRITNLKIEFPKPKSAENAVGRAAILRAEQYWWDPDKQRPRQTSVYSVSNIELVLRPFATLTGCHSVSIELPANVRNHEPTINFVSDLVRSMTSKEKPMLMSDELTMNIEASREAMEEYVNYTLHGKGYHAVPKLTEAEMEEDVARFEDEISDDDDDDNSSDDRKHDLSLVSENRGGDWERKPWQTRDEWADEQRVMLKSHQSVQEEEDRLIAEAIAASLGGTVASQAPNEQLQAPPNSYSYGGQTPMNSHTYGSYRSAGPDSRASTLGKSPFTGPGRTLASTVGSEGDLMRHAAANGLARASTSRQVTGHLPPNYGKGPRRYIQTNILGPTTASAYSSSDVTMAGDQMESTSSDGLPSTMTHLGTTTGPSPRLTQRGQVASIPVSGRAQGHYLALNALRARIGDRSQGSRNGMSPSVYSSASDHHAPGNRFASDFTQPNLQSRGRDVSSPSVWRRTEIVDLTGDADDEDDTQSSSTGGHAQSSTLSSPMRGRLRFGDRQFVFDIDGDAKEEVVDEVQK